MTAVLPRIPPSVEPRRVQTTGPAAPRSPALLREPVDRRPRYWDHEAAGWRPAPGAERC